MANYSAPYGVGALNTFNERDGFLEAGKGYTARWAHPLIRCVAHYSAAWLSVSSLSCPRCVLAGTCVFFSRSCSLAPYNTRGDSAKRQRWMVDRGEATVPSTLSMALARVVRERVTWRSVPWVWSRADPVRHSRFCSKGILSSVDYGVLTQCASLDDLKVRASTLCVGSLC